MTTGTKVFLACFALLVAGLVIYYGVLVPSGPREANADLKTLRPNMTTPAESSGQLPTDSSRFETTINEIANAGSAAPPISPTESTSVTQPETATLVDAPRAETSPPDPMPVRLATTEQPSTPAPVTYTVADGDTLSSIALDWLGDPNAWRRIRDANPGLDPDRLRVGSRIVLPGVTGPSETPRPGGVYVVRSGETLIDIARAAYGQDGMWKRIYDHNRAAITNPDVLEVGMRIRLPQS